MEDSLQQMYITNEEQVQEIEVKLASFRQNEKQQRKLQLGGYVFIYEAGLHKNY